MDLIQLLLTADPWRRLTLRRFRYPCWHRRPGGEHWQHIRSQHGTCLRNISLVSQHTVSSFLCWVIFSNFIFIFRTSPWLCTWGIIGRTVAWPSPPAATRVAPSMHVWWRRFGFLTCSLSTRNVRSSMTQPWRTSCWGCFLTATSFTVSGKKKKKKLRQYSHSRIITTVEICQKLLYSWLMWEKYFYLLKNLGYIWKDGCGLMNFPLFSCDLLHMNAAISVIFIFSNVTLSGFNLMWL